jgi:hypothetical protein
MSTACPKKQLELAPRATRGKNYVANRHGFRPGRTRFKTAWRFRSCGPIVLANGIRASLKFFKFIPIILLPAIAGWRMSISLIQREDKQYGPFLTRHAA